MCFSIDVPDIQTVLNEILVVGFPILIFSLVLLGDVDSFFQVF